MKSRLFRISQQVMLPLVLGLGLTLVSLWTMRGELTPPVYAATFNVDTTVDAIGGSCSVTCTLRDAIRLANANAGDDTINVSAGIYNLSITGRGDDIGVAGDLDIFSSPITGNLTIIGDTPENTIINANQLDRVFDIQPTGVTTVTLENLTITGGYVDQGGGVRIRSTTMGGIHLILNNVIIANNIITGTNQTPYPDGGGGLLNVQADVTLNNCRVSTNTAIVAGGGLGNLGMMTLVDTSVSANTTLSGSGGGIGNAGILSLDNSPVSGNRAADSYGLNTIGVGDGGGIANQPASASMGMVTLVDSPVSNNQADIFGGGIASSGGSLSLSNSPVSDNIGAGGGGIVQVNGQLILSNSAVSSNTLKSFTTTRSNVGNGGGILVSGIMTATDSPIVNNTAVGTSTAQGGGILNDGATWLINSPVVSNAAGILGGGIGNTPNGNLTLDNSPVFSNTLRNPVEQLGGGIFNNGQINLIDSPVSGNSAFYGGGIQNYGSAGPAAATLTRSDVTNNQATKYGGGIRSFNSVMTLTALAITDNQAGGKGGGIVNDTGSLFLSEVSISQNQAITTGGGIWQAEGSLIMMNSAVVDNDTDQNGGGLSIGYTSTVTITNSTFSGNTAFTEDSTDSSGGGIYEGDNWPKTITLNNVTIAGNEADIGGGLAQSGSGVINLANTIVASNTAYENANAISGTVHSDGYNLIDDTTGATLTGDLTGNIIDPEANLGALTGVPAYYPLLSGSLAINAGNPATPGGPFPACAAIDQPGATRPQGPICDIGAFEASMSNIYLPIILRE